MGSFRNVAVLLSLGLVVSGCASIIKGSSQSIAISTPPTTGALCNLSSAQGNWGVMSPGVASVEKSKEDIQIHCMKPGWQDAASTIPSNFEGWTLGNIVFGGIIGVGVDAATGAINEYPHIFQVPMTPLSAPGGIAPMALSAPPPIPATASVPVGPVASMPAAIPLPAAPMNPCGDDRPCGGTSVSVRVSP
jgi:hypothetical protein